MRIFYLDVVKAVAILMVLFGHATSVVPYTERNLFPMCTDYQITQLCNGLFIMASGALVLPSQIERGYPMCWRRVLKFLLLAAFWSMAYEMEKAPYYSSCILNIPSSTQITDDDIGFVVEQIKVVFKSGI